jgi:hypothetical protein
MGENIKIALKELVYEGLTWIHVAQDMNQKRVLAKIATNFRVP